MGFHTSASYHSPPVANSTIQSFIQLFLYILHASRPELFTFNLTPPPRGLRFRAAVLLNILCFYLFVDFRNKGNALHKRVEMSKHKQEIENASKLRSNTRKNMKLLGHSKYNKQKVKHILMKTIAEYASIVKLM